MCMGHGQQEYVQQRGAGLWWVGWPAAVGPCAVLTTLPSPVPTSAALLTASLAYVQVEAAAHDHAARHDIPLVAARPAYPCAAPLVGGNTCFLGAAPPPRLLRRQVLLPLRRRSRRRGCCACAYACCCCCIHRCKVRLPSSRRPGPPCERRHMQHRDTSICLMLAGMTTYMLSVSNHQVCAAHACQTLNALANRVCITSSMLS